MPFQVRIRNNNCQFEVQENESILSAALRQQIMLPWGCGSGICGSCMGQVLAGEIIYPDGPPLALFEEDAERGKALFCVGFARSDLLLDIPELN